MSEAERQEAMKAIRDRELDRHKRLLIAGNVAPREADREARRIVDGAAERADRMSRSR